ncbi:carbon-nitrogen hydrolase [Streptomyces abyssalis]|uniref:Carbon-nitrogen hydrolase n=1 Tax=Streptomyces abyssalis TaxID=933944 RepID=A0A1E7JTR1_9ACTN|nr:carbon-nitrogen hydrolase family protein [Streptomyces abyssalis]OEU92295.1 carbon-nitrogen hydrolase [Streptomyces abyssalis]OEU94750.1 carbon-nitrogen hydrolase [Streptomyces abyssalis]
MPTLRLALHQGPAGVPRTAEDGLAALDDAARAAAAGGARLLVTPELSLTGYALGDGVDGRAETADGPSARAVSRIAAAHGIAVVYGYPERDPDSGALHNSAALVGADGRVLAGYRKTHLYGDYETGHFTPGDRLLVQADLEGVRTGLLICYDVEFPEAVRAHALAGTELLVVPTALMRPYDFVAETVLPARAWENQLYVAYADRAGREGDFDFAGLSCLAAPDGSVPARAGRDEALLVADVDTALLHASRARNTYLTDRRAALYTT